SYDHIAHINNRLEYVPHRPIQKETRDAARAVAAGLTARAVGVVQRDEPAPVLLPSDREDSVGSNSAASVAQLARAVGRDLERPVDEDEIVPAALHLRELHAAASTMSSSGSDSVGS